MNIITTNLSPWEASTLLLVGRVLCDFEPAEVPEMYRSGWEGVLDDIVAELKPRGSVPRTSRSIWPRYCRSVLSGARFLSQFSTADDFYRWVDLFDEDERARPALSVRLVPPNARGRASLWQVLGACSNWFSLRDFPRLRPGGRWDTLPGFCSARTGC